MAAATVSWGAQHENVKEDQHRCVLKCVEAPKTSQVPHKKTASAPFKTASASTPFKTASASTPFHMVSLTHLLPLLLAIARALLHLLLLLLLHRFLQTQHSNGADAMLCVSESMP